MQHKTTLSLALLGEVSVDVKHIKSTVDKIDDRLSADERRNICTWLESTNPTSIHYRAQRNYEEHTCQWIHRMGQWNDWLELRRRMVWIHGIPGAGKTVLASHLVDLVDKHCKGSQNLKAVSVYYYCSFTHGREQDRDETPSFLRWTVSQLCRKTNRVPAILSECYRENHVPSHTVLLDALRQLLTFIDVVYLTIDAIDESSPRKDLLGLLRDFVTNPDFAKIQLLATSRRYEDIMRVLSALSEPTLPMQNEVVDMDIRIYAKTEMARNDVIQYWPDEVRSTILDALVEGAKGMFRWVVCQIDRLHRKSPDQAMEAIKHLPVDIEATYVQILSEMAEEDKSDVRTILLWIMYHTENFDEFGFPVACVPYVLQPKRYFGGRDSAQQCDNHTSLKGILGCLVEIHEAQAEDDREEFMLAYFGLELKCHHYMTLAHYTVHEFPVSEQIRNTKISCFGISSEESMYIVLELALGRASRTNLPYSEDEPDDMILKYCTQIMRENFGQFAQLIASRERYWTQFYAYFLLNRTSWIKFHCYTAVGSMSFEFPTSRDFRFQGDETQFLIAMLCSECYLLSDRILDKLDIEVLLSSELPCLPVGTHGNDNLAHLMGETPPLIWYPRNHCTLLHAKACFLPCGLGEETPLEALLELLKTKLEPSKLLLFYLDAHYHFLNCDGSCMIEDLLASGAISDPNGFGLTPLQVCAHNWDEEGTALLLEHGANPNRIGTPGGFIPAHLEAAWTQASPLHILRNILNEIRHEYDKFTGDDLAKRARIENLLLKHGAKDFNNSKFLAL